MSRKEDLETRVSAARTAYYNLTPIMSDIEFDALMDELRSLDPSNVSVVSVGSSVPSHSVWKKVAHEIPMGSLDKVNSADGFFEWANRTGSSTFCMTDKLDGSSMELVYESGKLVRCVTRGDGIVGEDVTFNVSQIPNVLHITPYESDFTIRGEVIMSKSVFAEKYSADHANPRNTAAGKIRDKKNSGSACKDLEFVAYWVSPHPDGVISYLDMLRWLGKTGFGIPANASAGSIDYILEDFEAVRSTNESSVEKSSFRVSRSLLPYEIDGMVVSVDALDALDALGELNMRPRGQIAWKFDAEARETTVSDIRWQVGPTGRVTPVAILVPVSIGGVTITNVSLHNIGFFNNLSLFPGCRVVVSRRNDCIPYIEKSLDDGFSRSDLFMVPVTCPACSSSLVPNGSFFIMCPSKSCPSKSSGSVKVWVARLGLLHWGDSLVESLTNPDNPVVLSVADLYRLTVEDIATCTSGFKMAQKCYDTLHANISVKLELVLSAMNIPNFGLSTASDIVTAGYDTVDKVLSMSVDDLVSVPNVGPMTAAQVHAGLSERADVLRDLSLVIDILGPTVGSLSGKSFCITGSTSVPRKTLQKRILDSGGIVKDSVGSGLSFLVTNETTQTSKRKAADKHGVPVISESDLTTMINCPDVN